MNGEVYRAAISNLSMILEEGGRGRESVLGEKLRSRCEDDSRKKPKAPQQGPTETALSSALQGEKTADQGSSKGGVGRWTRSGRRADEGFSDAGRANPVLARRINCLRASSAPHALLKDSPAWSMELHNYPVVYPMDEVAVLSSCAGPAVARRQVFLYAQSCCSTKNLALGLRQT